MTSDSELVRSTLSDDQRAFDELVRRHYGMALRIACRFADVPADADDLVQEAFITACERLDQLADPERFAGWLATIVRNQGRMWHRRRFTQPTLIHLDGGADFACGAASTEQARESERRAAIRHAVSEALSTLTPGQREAVRLHYLDGYDYRETALLLDIPVAAVRGRLDRARSTLRKELLEMAAKTEWYLNAQDLDAIRAAGMCAANPSDEDHKVLNSLCLTGNGELVSTDCHRLFRYASRSLEGVPAMLVDAMLGRILHHMFPEMRKGRLALDEHGASILFKHGKGTRANRVKGDYPNWRVVVPETWKLRVRAKARDWQSALETLAQQSGPGSSDMESNRIVVILSPQTERITLRKWKGATPESGISWEASASFPTEYAEGGQEFAIAANATYVTQAISALGLEADGMVELLANGPLDPFMTRPADNDQVFMVTMPMQAE